MARVFFETGSKGGVGISVSSIGFLDYFEMKSRKVSLVETDTTNPNVGNSLETSSIRTVAMIPPSDAALNFTLADRSEAVRVKNDITMQDILEKTIVVEAAS